MNSTKFEMTACRMFVQWPREVGAMGGCKRPGGTFQGAAFFKEDKNVRPVYGHLNALQLPPAPQTLAPPLHGAVLLSVFIVTTRLNPFARS